jgi:hypothetical protein
MSGVPTRVLQAVLIVVALSLVATGAVVADYDDAAITSATEVKQGEVTQTIEIEVETSGDNTDDGAQELIITSDGPTFANDSNLVTNGTDVSASSDGSILIIPFEDDDGGTDNNFTRTFDVLVDASTEEVGTYTLSAEMFNSANDSVQGSKSELSVQVHPEAASKAGAVTTNATVMSESGDTSVHQFDIGLDSASLVGTSTLELDFTSVLDSDITLDALSITNASGEEVLTDAEGTTAGITDNQDLTVDLTNAAVLAAADDTGGDDVEALELTAIVTIDGDAAGDVTVEYESFATASLTGAPISMTLSTRESAGLGTGDVTSGAIFLGEDDITFNGQDTATGDSGDTDGVLIEAPIGTDTPIGSYAQGNSFTLREPQITTFEVQTGTGDDVSGGTLLTSDADAVVSVTSNFEVAEGLELTITDEQDIDVTDEFLEYDWDTRIGGHVHVHRRGERRHRRGAVDDDHHR